ncbi:hypothetical protein [Shinella sp.]|uniref:hypothetical protein n=1 Tax=Shinella sp. TaxID=1870904 RepID=UPI003D283E15
MKRTKIIKRFDSPLLFSASALDKEARLYFHIVDSLADDVLFHVEFDREAGQLSVKERYAGAWSKPQTHDFPFKGQSIKGKLFLEGETFILELKDFRLEFPCKAFPKSIVWSVYSNFRYMTIGDDETVTEALSRRWRFFPEYRFRMGLGSRLRALGETEALKPGLCGLYLWDGNEDTFVRLVEKVHSHFDEILVIIHNSSLFQHSFFVGLQSTHFNIRTSVIEMTVKSDGALRKLKGALFMNRALSEVRHRNIVLLDSGTDPEHLTAVVRDKRLRSRTDDFLLLDDGHSGDLQAFSIGKQTYFVEAGGKLHLSPEDIAGRHPIYAPVITPRAGLQWDVDEVRLSDSPILLRDQKKISHLPRRGKLAVLVVSCKKNRHKQQAIRDTWAKDARLANIDVYFIEGHPEQSQALLFEDRLVLPVPDTYEYLSHKIWHGVSAALRIIDADYYFKLDDDCLLNVQKLLEFAYENFDYIGSDVNLGSRTAFDWHSTAVSNKQLAGLIFEIDPEQTWYDGQGGYFLSQKAARLIASTPLPKYQHILEDYATGRVMSANGLEATSLNSKFLSIREIYIKDDRDYEGAVISDVSSVERTFELYEIISKLNQQTLEAKNRWRFEFPEEDAK